MPDRPESDVWDHLRNLAGKEVPLLVSSKSIRVLAVGEEAVTIEKSTGSIADIRRSMLESVANEIARRGYMNRAEILTFIGGKYHSSSISALLAALPRFHYTRNPITLWFDPGSRTAG